MGTQIHGMDNYRRVVEKIRAGAIGKVTRAHSWVEGTYVVKDAKTKHCTIVDKKPVDTTTTVVSPSGTVYKTRTEAEAGMKTVKVCSSN